MALSSELMLRLEGDEPLTKRLKLAENAYCSTDLAITGKEDLIVEWLCKIAPTDLVVWKSLNLCIHCQNSNNRTIRKHQARKKLVNTLTNKLKLIQEDLTLDVIDCCNFVLSNPGMQQYFQTALYKLGHFLHHLFIRLKSNTSKLDSDDEKKSILNNARHNCIINAIESIVQMHKQHSEKDKIAITFLDHVLSPLCALIDPTCNDSSNRVGAEAHKCIQQILFKGRNIEYKEYSEENGKECLPAKLFAVVSKLASKTEDDHVPIVMMTSYVFRAAVGVYKTESALLDSLFRGIVNASGALKITVSNYLIEYLAVVPLEYGNKIDGIDLTEFLNNLIDETLSKEDLSDKDYCLLRNIVGLNPLVIENKLPLVFKRILLERRDTESEEQSYARLMNAILDASSRLRREQKLIPWVLLALQVALVDNKDCPLSAVQILPINFTSKLTVLVSGLHSPQIVAMLRSLTFHLKSNCVGEYRTEPTNQVSLMAECTVLLLISFFNGIRIFERSVPIAVQQKFANALGELGKILSALDEKILNSKHNERILIVLLDAVLYWSKVHSLLDHYAPKSEARNIPFPISENELQQLFQRVQNFGDTGCIKALNNFFFYRIKENLSLHKLQEKLTGFIGGLENSWRVILEDYPELIPLLNIDQLSELGFLILADIIAGKSSLDKWRETFETEILQENEAFVIAILCNALIKIGLIIKGSVTATITARINLAEILQDKSNDASVPALDRNRKIGDVVQWPNLDKDDTSIIEKCLQTLLCIPLSFLSIPLRTMIFVTTYTIDRECGCNEEIRSLCDNVLFDTLDEGGLNVFDFINSISLMDCLVESKVLQKVFNMSFRNAAQSSSSEYLASLNNCPDEAVSVVLSCIENFKPKLNNEQKLVLSKVEKKLGKKVLSTIEKNLISAKETRRLIMALKVALGRNKVKTNLKQSIISTLQSIFMDDDDGERKLTDENEKSNGKDLLIKEGLELAVIALQQRARLDLPEQLVTHIWKIVLKYPQTKLLIPLLEASIPKVFSEVLLSLNSQTERNLQEKDIAKLNSTLGIWDCIVRSDMGTARNKSRLNATRKLLHSLQMLEIASEYWLDLIQLLTTIVNTKYMQLSGNYIDMIILTAGRSLREGNLIVCDDVLVLCLALLRSRIGIMTDRLPLLLQLYRKAITLIAREARNENTMNRHQLALCALNVEKVTGALVKMKRDVVRVGPYVISDLVNNFAEGDLQPAIKESFKNCINNLLSICDPHGVSFLLRALPTANREIFKDINDMYNKYNRFTGKI